MLFSIADLINLKLIVAKTALCPYAIKLFCTFHIS